MFFLRSVLAALAFVGVAGVPASASIIQITDFTPGVFNAYAASATDLLQSASGSSIGYQPVPGFGQPHLVLWDGSSGGNTTASGGWPSLVLESGDTGADQFWTVTFNLNLAGAPAGYDLTQINTISGWIDGRAGHGVSIFVSRAGNPAFSPLGTFTTGPLANGGARIRLTDTTSTLATGIDAIRFENVSNVGSNGAVLREFDVFGTPSAGPAPPQVDPIVLTFEGMPAMPNAPGSPIPPAARLSDAFLSAHGVRFGSGGPFVAVVNLGGGGGATSGVNAIGGSTPAGLLTYDRGFPIVAAFFDPGDPFTPAVTDLVSVRGDTLGGGLQPLTLNGFDVNGALITSVTVPNVFGGATLSLSAPGIHSVQFLGTNDPDGVALDDFTFNPVTRVAAVPEPSAAILFGVGTTVALFSVRRRRDGFIARSAGTEPG